MLEIVETHGKKSLELTCDCGGFNTVAYIADDINELRAFILELNEKGIEAFGESALKNLQ